MFLWPQKSNICNNCFKSCACARTFSDQLFALSNQMLNKTKVKFGNQARYSTVWQLRPKMEETTFSADKSQNVLVTLREHLSVAFPNLSACVPMSQIRNDTTGNISMVMPLKSKSEPTGSSTKGYINMGLPLDTPTFMLQVFHHYIAIWTFVLMLRPFFSSRPWQ